MPEGLPTLAEAFAAAADESSEAMPDEPLADSPPVEEEPAAEAEQAEVPAPTEQPEAASEESILDLLSTEGPEATGVALGSDEFWGQEIDVATATGNQRVQLSELRDGYLRQSDYTRKTQEVARERELVTEAVDFHKAFKEDPVAFAKYIANRAGLIEEGAATPEGVKLYTEEDLGAEVDKRLEAAVAEHPDVKAAADSKATQAVEAALKGIEDKYGVTLKRDHKILILTEAQRTNTPNLELVYEALVHRAMRKDQERKQAAGSSPARPAAAPRTEVSATPQVPADPAEAMAMAFAELGLE